MNRSKKNCDKTQQNQRNKGSHELGNKKHFIKIIACGKRLPNAYGVFSLDSYVQLFTDVFLNLPQKLLFLLLLILLILLLFVP